MELEEAFDIRAIPLACRDCLVDDEIFCRCSTHLDSTQLDLFCATQCFVFEREPCIAEIDVDTGCLVAEQKHLAPTSEGQRVRDSGHDAFFGEVLESIREETLALRDQGSAA